MPFAPQRPFLFPLLCSGLVCSAVLSAAFASAAEANLAPAPVGWRNQGHGHFVTDQPPTAWTTEHHIRWKTKMPAGSHSSPIVVGDCVLTTSEPADLLCLDLASGDVRWQRSHQYEDFMPDEKARHIESQLANAKGVQEKIQELQKELQSLQQPNEKESPEAPSLTAQIETLQKQYDELTVYPPPLSDGTGNATCTPVSDGRDVWAVFATGIVSSHQLDGQRNWMKFIERPGGRMTSSPLLVDGLLIIHLKHLIALNPDDGTVVWQVETPARAGTPVAVAAGDTALIVTPAGAVVRARDGQLLAEGLFDLAYCSPIAHEDVVYAMERGKIKALRIHASEQGADAQVLWEARGSQDDRCASPLFHNGLLYSVTTNGILDVVDAATGERVYRERLGLGEGRMDPSLAMAGERLFVSSNNGTTLVMEPGREFKEVARNPLEAFSSSPFFHDTQLCIRTAAHLYCIGE